MMGDHFGVLHCSHYAGEQRDSSSKCDKPANLFAPSYAEYDASYDRTGNGP